MELIELLRSNASDKEILRLLEDMHSFDIVKFFEALEPEEIERIKNILPTE
jgi:Mg/Co/Ni transporter MgtE